MYYIYRMENENQKGCYVGVMEENGLSHHEGRESNPHPNNDFGINRFPTKKEICGFQNLSQAQKWFTPNEIQMLNKKGYELKKVKVKQITALGKCQVLAIR